MFVIWSDFYLHSFLPYLRRSIQNLVRKYFPEYLHVNNSSIDPMASETRREFSVAFYGLPVIHRIRELKTDKIGQLISLSGTVTRTTEVRPELVYATFTCNLCSRVYRDVEQQFKYTEVIFFPHKIMSEGTKIRWLLTDFYLNSPQPVRMIHAVIEVNGHLTLNNPSFGIGKRSEFKKTPVKFLPEVCLEREYERS